jgi:hypothetical protein
MSQGKLAAQAIVALIVGWVTYRVLLALFIGAREGAWYQPVLPLITLAVVLGVVLLVGKAFSEEPPQR